MRDRLRKTLRGVRMTLEREERVAAIVPGRRMLRNRRQHAIIAGDGFHITPKAPKRVGAIVERH